MRDDSDTADVSDDISDGVTRLYCRECQRGVCPFCGQPDDCPHVVAFSRSGDFSGSSLCDWLPAESEYGHYLHMVEVDEDWHLLDRLIKELPDAVVTIEFDASAHWNALGYADLRSSISTAQWADRDAREGIEELVDDLNDKGQQFAFIKDVWADHDDQPPMVS